MTLAASIRHALARVFANKMKHNIISSSSTYRQQSSLPNLQWINMLDRRVHLYDGSEAGKIEAINRDKIVIKNGSLRTTRYYVDHSMLEKKVDGHFVLQMTKVELLLFRREMVPNPSCYVTLGGSYFGYMPHIDQDDDLQP
jgi:hypothetical protein